MRERWDSLAAEGLMVCYRLWKKEGCACSSVCAHALAGAYCPELLINWLFTVFAGVKFYLAKDRWSCTSPTADNMGAEGGGERIEREREDIPHTIEIRICILLTAEDEEYPDTSHDFNQTAPKYSDARNGIEKTKDVRNIHKSSATAYCRHYPELHSKPVCEDLVEYTFVWNILSITDLYNPALKCISSLTNPVFVTKHP